MRNKHGYLDSSQDNWYTANLSNSWNCSFLFFVDIFFYLWYDLAGSTGESFEYCHDCEMWMGNR
jgi:hypothetical protein